MADWKVVNIAVELMVVSKVSWMGDWKAEQMVALRAALPVAMTVWKMVDLMADSTDFSMVPESAVRMASYWQAALMAEKTVAKIIGS